jgi:hypothetical protein
MGGHARDRSGGLGKGRFISQEQQVVLDLLVAQSPGKVRALKGPLQLGQDLVGVDQLKALIPPSVQKLDRCSLGVAADKA